MEELDQPCSGAWSETIISTFFKVISEKTKISHNLKRHKNEMGDENFVKILVVVAGKLMSNSTNAKFSRDFENQFEGLWPDVLLSLALFCVEESPRLNFLIFN